MSRRVPGLVLILAFSVALGHLAWRALLGPPNPEEYVVGGTLPILRGPDPGQRQLYLRRALYLPQRPRHAWIRVLARDHVDVFVNGTLVGTAQQDGFPVAVVADIAPNLNVGTNAIAIEAEQTTRHGRPGVSVEGAYVLSDGAHPIRADQAWRCRHAFERGATWWFMADFRDRTWPFATVETGTLRAKVSDPPRATTEEGVGRWITPAPAGGRLAAARREFNVDDRPRQAWLRLTATSSYRLAVNGIVVDDQQDQVGTRIAVVPTRRSYDLTSVMRRGRNDVSLLLTSNTGTPHLLAELEVEDDSGHRLRASSDGRWLGRPGRPPDWLDPGPVDRREWRPCAVETGDLDIPPWQPTRQDVDIVLPPSATLVRIAEEWSLMALIGVVTALLCRFSARLLAMATGGGPSRDALPVMPLALVLPTLAIAAAVLATYDPRVARQDVYNAPWVFLAALSVPLQWALLAASSRSDRRGGSPPRREAVAVRPRVSPAAVYVLALMAAGSWLRYRGIADEPLHPDEWYVHRASTGFLQRGFPSLQIHKDLPVTYSSTSELVYVINGTLGLICHEDYMIVRFPAVCWGTATIALLYLTGRRLFGTSAGLIAATIYAFAPVCIEMANFGRYYSQLQFFTLLTVRYFWETIRGSGPVARRALWRTTLAFLASFLSWEGAALLAPGMILAMLVQRRGRLWPILRDPAVWAALMAVVCTILVQLGHRELQQVKRLEYGTGAQDVTLKPMWRYPDFDPTFYIWDSSWTPDAFLPMVALAGAGLLTLRHGLRRPARFLAIIYLGNCLFLSTLLPLKIWRYSYYVTPLLILLASAALQALARGLTRQAGRSGAVSWRRYARAVAALVVVAFVALGGGMTVQLPEMSSWQADGYRYGQLKFPQLSGPVAYLREHIREGDVVIATLPHVTDHYLKGRTSDYWLQTRLSLKAILDDKGTTPRHLYIGTELVSDLESLEALLARSDRVWYVSVPEFHSDVNRPEISRYLLQNMEIVYEDCAAVLLLRDRNHRSAGQRFADDAALKASGAVVLP